MIIRRDNMMHTTASAQPIVAASTRGFSPPVAANISQHITTSTITKLAIASGLDEDNSSQSPSSNYTFATPNGNQAGSRGTGTGNANANVMQAGLPVYTMNPLQQREAMLREAWENERRNLLKKASNQQGDSCERLLANYFVV